jgi:amino acid transporter
MPSPLSRLKRLLFGRPLPSDRLEHERLSKTTALAVLSSDAISSVAYATEQILLVLAVLGTAALTLVVPVSVVIVALLALVALSYRQTVFAYPEGGGSYTVAKANLGVGAGLLAAAALLTDYVLTVAVSISAGVAAITSAYPVLAPHMVAAGAAAILVLMLVNLRGARDSGAVFSVPTYVFIVLMLLLLGAGLYQGWADDRVAESVRRVAADPLSASPRTGAAPIGFALAFLVLRAFAEGCVAMTGTEAISNGVSAFKRPPSRNAATTLGWMAAILGAFFLGTSYLVRRFGVMPTAEETVLSQLGHHVFGGGPLYFALQYATFALLVLAANTAFADFPRLASILARDGYMPRQFAARGDRLVFSNGIVALALVAALLIWLFGGDTHALIPLYAIGVFVCFTLSQAGMVQHWLNQRGSGWRRRATLNGVGAVATGAVAVIQVVTKFAEGAWIVVLIIPLLIWVLRATRRHYEQFAREVRFTGQAPIMFLHHTVVVPVSGVTKATAGALVYATAISDDVRAVHVDVDPATTAQLREEWGRWDVGVELVVLESPYRSVLRPIADYVSRLECGGEADLISVVVPEVVPHRWWEYFLHNKTALYIKTTFLFRPNVVVIAVPYHLGRAFRWRDLVERDQRVDELRPEAA